MGTMIKFQNDFVSQGSAEAVARGVLSKRCSWKFHKIHRKTLVPESLF